MTDTLKIFQDLAAPIPQHLVKTLTTKYKDKKTGEFKQFSVSYITARTVMNRLDEVVGPANWRTEFTSDGLPPNTIRCELFIRIDGEWIGKSDVGTMTDVEPEKGMVSDAMKRAAVHWGIARELYREGTANLEGDDDTVPQREPQPARKKGHDYGATLQGEISNSVFGCEDDPRGDAPEGDEFPTVRSLWPSVANTLLAKHMSQLPEGLGIGGIVMAVDLGYANYEAAKTAQGLKHAREFDGTLHEFLSAVIDRAPRYNGG